VSTWPFATAAAALAVMFFARKWRDPWPKIVLPLGAAAIFVAYWHFAVDLKSYDARQLDGTLRRVDVFATPAQALPGLLEPLRDGTLVRFSIASVYRVAVGFVIAACIGIPVGLWAGWYTRGYQTINPLIQFFRPISPIAWIPVAIVWYGVRDSAAIFLIVYASMFPIVTGTLNAVRTIPAVYVRSAQNFGLTGFELFRRVIFPACLPQIVISLRIALGIAWLVIVAAEMCGIESGLGYQILDARNASNYPRVVGAMIAIGLIGVVLDLAMRRLERFDEVKWGFPKEDA
jgi:NitT/TauT family transport system permease protein